MAAATNAEIFRGARELHSSVPRDGVPRLWELGRSFPTAPASGNLRMAEDSLGAGPSSGGLSDSDMRNISTCIGIGPPTRVDGVGAGR